MELTGYSTFEALSTMANEVEASAAYFGESLSLGVGQNARRIETVAHSRDYFTVLGVQPLLGSWTDPSNAAREDAAVISYGLWHREFGGSYDVLGKPLRLGLDTYSIVAVAPRGFAGSGFTVADVWLPLPPRARAGFGPSWTTANAIFLRVIARLRPGVGRDVASDHATGLYRARHTAPWEKNNSIVLGDLRPARAPGVRVGTRLEVLVALMSILLLLITCGNVANFLLVRGLHRDREFFIKAALGASRPRLVREVLLEAAVLAAGAGVVALLPLTLGATLIRREFLSPTAALALPIDARLVLVTLAFCVAAAFLLGLAPAFRLTTRRAFRPGPSAVVRPSRILDVFSGIQVALTLPMIVAAALFVLSLWNARHQDFGMQTDRVAVVSTDLFEVGRPSDNHAVHRQVQGRIELLPQVESTALVQNLPLQHTVSFFIEVPGKDAMNIFGGNFPYFNGVDPSFFAVMRMRLVQGRLFSEQENRKGARPVAVITNSMAKTIWPGEPAIGKCFYQGSQLTDSQCTEVVGVVADARLFPSVRPTNMGRFAYYVPIEQVAANASSRALLVRTLGDPESVLEILRHEAQNAGPDLPYVDGHAFDDIFSALLKPWRLGSIVFGAFGALSMVIAAIGLMVVGAYGVTRRTREIGICSALGAEPHQLVKLVLRRSLFVVAAGLVVGLGLAWASGRILNAQLFDITASEPRVLAGAVLGVLLVGAFAAWVPARRAARIDPIIALRAE
jgi:predicted permease